MSEISSPLSSQVKKILINQGYKPIMGESLFMKDTPSLVAKFMEVTNNGVRPFGVLPRPAEESHVSFVTRNVRYLFK